MDKILTVFYNFLTFLYMTYVQKYIIRIELDTEFAVISNLSFKRIPTSNGEKERGFTRLREQSYIILHQRKCRDIKQNILTSVLAHNHPSFSLPLDIVRKQLPRYFRSDVRRTYLSHVRVCARVYARFLFPFRTTISAPHKNEQ